ncbi:SMI1/KNR4 family protein [Streptomyces sp. NPDC090022]|uniref:SMI1/KNR4 family protein n=1 Tax=Streptomyces sp. NPDC090022 TaxID=3365920 RepID=UPI0037FDFE73
MARPKNLQPLPGSLARLVPPPAEPVDARGDWAVVEQELGVRLPEDYKALVERYGWGEFCDFVYLHTPFGNSPYNGLKWQSGSLAEPLRWDGRKRYPYPLHPAPGGALIWGTTMDADRLCWLTAGDPEHWPVVMWSRDGEYETFPMGAAEFIEGWTGGHVSSRHLADMEPDLAPWFNTFRPRNDRCIRLSEGPLPHAERLRMLRSALAPTADRGTWRTEDGQSGQDHFATTDTDWQLTYDMANPHQIRISYPPHDHGTVHRRLTAAIRLMACNILAITTAAGTPLPTWDTTTDEDDEPQ